MTDHDKACVMSPEKLAAIMADHTAPHTCIGGLFKNAGSSRSMPCLPYRLAEALTASFAATVEDDKLTDEISAERDRIAAELAAERAKVERVRDALDPFLTWPGDSRRIVEAVLRALDGAA